MHILVSNDDGYFSKGLKVLVIQLQSAGHRVTVVAPDRNMSGCGQSLSLRKPVNVRRIEEQVYAVEGTPADCVYLALHGLIDDVDLVVSGINHGSNLGDDLLYSGTFAAAMEARKTIQPNIAVSITEHNASNFETAAKVVCDVIDRFDDFPFKKEVAVLNINVPDLPYKDLKGIKTTRLGSRQVSQAPKVEQTLRGNLTYWIGLTGEFQPGDDDEDFMAVQQGYVSLTPLSSQLLHQPYLSDVDAWFAGDDKTKKLDIVK